MATKKLIEVALPLEKINASAAYEKMPGIGAHPRVYIFGGHVALLLLLVL